MTSPVKLLSAQFVLPIAGDPIPDGAVAVEDGKIAQVGPRKEILKEYGGSVAHEFDHAVLMPGLVNADTRLELLSFDGKGQNGFVDRLLARMEFAQRINTSDCRANIREGIGQLLRSGATSAGDVGRYTGTIPLFVEAPLRWVLFPEVLTSTHPTTTENYQSVLANLDEIVQRQSERLAAGLSPFSAYTLSKNLLMVLAREAEGRKIPLKIRVSESFAEMQFFFESAGEIVEKLFPKLGWQEAAPPAHRKTPIQFLDAIGFLESRPILIGCLHLAEADYEILQRRKCKVVWKPRADRRFNAGKAPVRKWLKAELPIGLGTEGSDSLSLWDEMRAALELCPAGDLLKMATLGGARVLGRDREIGSLEAGKKADLIAVKLPRSVKSADLAKQLVERTTEVLAVFVDGEKITP